MPRPNPPRPLGCEVNVARRVADERGRRGWSYETLARHMTEAGCPIQSSAIYKIEKGDPPRRISVDELVAFALAFDVDVKELLLSPWEAAQREARELATKLADTLDRMGVEQSSQTREMVALLMEAAHGDRREIVDQMSPTPPQDGG
ncbi:MAG: helix-turn-helix domain-containing protein [Mycobacterium sp.]